MFLSAIAGWLQSRCDQRSGVVGHRGGRILNRHESVHITVRSMPQESLTFIYLSELLGRRVRHVNGGGTSLILIGLSVLLLVTGIF
jgi:hypothetical protein